MGGYGEELGAERGDFARLEAGGEEAVETLGFFLGWDIPVGTSLLLIIFIMSWC